VICIVGVYNALNTLTQLSLRKHILTDH